MLKNDLEKVSGRHGIDLHRILAPVDQIIDHVATGKYRRETPYIILRTKEEERHNELTDFFRLTLYDSRYKSVLLVNACQIMRRVIVEEERHIFNGVGTQRIEAISLHLYSILINNVIILVLL